MIAFDPNYRTRPEEFRYEWSSGRRSRTLFTGQRETTTSRAAIRAFPFDADGDYFIEVTAIDLTVIEASLRATSFGSSFRRLPQAGSYAG